MHLSRPIPLRLALACVLTCALAWAPGQVVPALAQSNLNRPIKLGRSVRTRADRPTCPLASWRRCCSRALAQSVVIENRPGAGGALGTKSVAAAEPDGATLLIGTSATLGVVPALMKNPGYDPIRNFAPVARSPTAPWCW
jgi:hypothetical protein